MTALEPNCIYARARRYTFYKLFLIMDLIDSSQSLTCSLSRSGCHQTNTMQTYSEVITNVCGNTKLAFIFPIPLGHLRKLGRYLFFDLVSYGIGK